MDALLVIYRFSLVIFGLWPDGNTAIRLGAGAGCIWHQPIEFISQWMFRPRVFTLLRDKTAAKPLFG